MAKKNVPLVQQKSIGRKLKSRAVMKIKLTDPKAILNIFKIRDLDGRDVMVHDTGNGVTITPILSADESRRRFDAAQADMHFPDNASDLDSEWWIRTIKKARVDKTILVDFDKS